MNILNEFLNRNHTTYAFTQGTWIKLYINNRKGFPGGTSDKEPACQYRRHKRHRFSPWVGKIHQRRAWRSTPVFLPEESPWTQGPGRLSPWAHTESDTTEAT